MRLIFIVTLVFIFKCLVCGGDEVAFDPRFLQKNVFPSMFGYHNENDRYHEKYEGDHAGVNYRTEQMDPIKSRDRSAVYMLVPGQIKEFHVHTKTNKEGGVLSKSKPFGREKLFVGDDKGSEGNVLAFSPNYEHCQLVGYDHGLKTLFENGNSRGSLKVYDVNNYPSSLLDDIPKGDRYIPGTNKYPLHYFLVTNGDAPPIVKMGHYPKEEVNERSRKDKWQANDAAYYDDYINALLNAEYVITDAFLFPEKEQIESRTLPFIEKQVHNGNDVSIDRDARIDKYFDDRRVELGPTLIWKDL